MSHVFLALILISLLMIPVALIKPTWALPPRMKPGRLRGAGAWACVLIPAFILFGLTNEPLPEDAAASGEAARAGPVQEAQAEAATDAGEPAESEAAESDSAETTNEDETAADTATAEQAEESTRETPETKAAAQAEAEQAVAEEQAEPETLEERLARQQIGHYSVRAFRFNAETKAYVLDIEAGPVVTEENMFYHAARWLRFGLQEFADDETEAEKVSVTLSASTVDRLGNVSIKGLAIIHFPMADIRRANLINLPGVRVLNLGRLRATRGPAARAIVRFCLHPDMLREASEFCANLP